MSNNHERKIVPNFLFGIMLITLGILLIIYDVKSQIPQISKEFVVVGIVILINGGLYFWGNAFVHKVKSDLIRRQKKHHEREAAQEF